jgi:hypothetical protein
MGKVSFCTTCKGRLYQFRQTIFKNIEDNADHPDTEFVVLNHNSPDHLDDWVRDNLKPFLESGKLCYYKMIDVLPWHVCHAKNAAHRLATGEIVCNLDGDNFTGPGFASFINAEIAKNRDIIGWLRRGSSTCGRIYLLAEHFKKLGGYDEKFMPMSYQDMDLIARAQKIGLKLVHTRDRAEFTQVIPNANDKTKYCKANLSLMMMDQHNRAISKRRMDMKIYSVNPGGYGKCKVLKNFTEIIELA